MAIENKPAVETATGCKKCHRDSFLRMLHLLRNFPDERAAAGHLKAEYGDQPFIESELKWRRFIIENYAGKVDEWGNRMPLWLAFAKSKAIVTKTPTGFHMKPKLANAPTPDEIRDAFRSPKGNRMNWTDQELRAYLTRRGVSANSTDKIAEKVSEKAFQAQVKEMA